MNFVLNLHLDRDGNGAGPRQNPVPPQGGAGWLFAPFATPFIYLFIIYIFKISSYDIIR